MKNRMTLSVVLTLSLLLSLVGFTSTPRDSNRKIQGFHRGRYSWYGADLA